MQTFIFDTVELESGKPYHFWEEYIIPEQSFSYTYTVDAPPGVTYVLTPIYEHFAVNYEGITVELPPEHYNLYFDFTVTLGLGYLSAANTVTLTIYHSFYFGTSAVVRPFRVTGPSPLFTADSDSVNFNALTAAQQKALDNGADPAKGLGGSDWVTLNEEVPSFSTESRLGDTYTVVADGGAYTIRAGAGTDNISINSEGANTIIGGHGDLTVFIYGSGANTITASTRSDNVGVGRTAIAIQGDGDNHIDGGSGQIDVTIKGKGSNTIILGTGGGTFSIEGNGNNVIDGSHSGPGMTVEIVGTGSNTISGGASEDTIKGGSGVDIINGGPGTDVLNGGEGLDTAVFSGNGASYSFFFEGPYNWKAWGPDAGALPDKVLLFESYQFDNRSVSDDLLFKQLIATASALELGKELHDTLVQKAKLNEAIDYYSDALANANQIVSQAGLLQWLKIVQTCVNSVLDVLAIFQGPAVSAIVAGWQLTVEVGGLVADNEKRVEEYGAAVLKEGAPLAAEVKFGLVGGAIATFLKIGYEVYEAVERYEELETLRQLALEQLADFKAKLEELRESRQDLGNRILEIELQLRDFYQESNGLPKVRWEGQPLELPTIDSPSPSRLAKAAEDYLSHAMAFSDDNENGVWDASETWTITSTTGSFLVPEGTGPLRVIGGIDAATGLPFKGQLTAPAGSSVVNPLTTIITAAGTNPATLAKILENLGLASAFDPTTFDPIAATLAGDARGPAAQVAAAKLYNAVSLIGSALAGIEGTYSGHSHEVFLALATALAGPGIDLLDQGALAALIDDVVNSQGITSPAGLSDVVASIAAAGNAALDQSLQTAENSVALLMDLSAVALVIQGAASEALAAAGGEIAQLNDIGSQFTGSNLAARVAQAEEQLANGGSFTVSVSALSAAKAEGDSSTVPFTFTVTLNQVPLETLTVDWAVTGTGVHAASGSDFVGGELRSGVVSFGIGETLKTLTIDVAGDTVVESDEGFTVTLSNPSTGLTIGIAAANGTIVNDDSSIVSIVESLIAQAEGDSGATTFVFTVSLDQESLSPQTIDWTVIGAGDHPAVAGDFAGGVLPSGTVTLAPGETSATITVSAAGETSVEFDEFFTVKLSNPSAGLTLGTASAVGDIQNDDRATISLAPLSAVKAEGHLGTTTVFTFAVSLDQPSVFGTQTADWSVTGTGSNAADATDFGGTLPSGTVSFVAGETIQVVTVLVAGDTTPEFNEDFTIILSNLTFGLQLGTASATGTILNDDKLVVSVTAGPGSKAEGTGGTSAFEWTVSLDRASVTSQTVAWAVSGTGASPVSGSDFTGGVLPTGTLTFAPGETTKTVSVGVVGDSVVEFDEGVVLVLSSPSSDLDLGSAMMVGTIQNDDLSVVSIGAQSARKAEGNSGTTPFTFTVTLDQAGVSSQTVAWTLAGSGAHPASPGDFAGSALNGGMLTFNAGETSQTITVEVVGDTAVEPDEEFGVTLSNPSAGLAIGTATATGTIQNDDGSTVSIAALSAVKAEGDSGTTPYIFTISLDQAVAASQTVSWAVAGSGANPADALDFVGGAFPAGAVTFAAGETSKTITIAVAGDVFVEADESFLVTLSAPSPGLALGTTTATGTIQNDDVAATVTAHGDAYVVHEGQTLTVPLSASLLANDLNASTASLLSGPAHGSLQLVGSGNFTYTPAAGFHGIDSFTYQAGNNGSSLDEAQATIHVVPVSIGATTTLDLLALTADEQIAATYVAFFGRAADAAGQAFWVGEFVRGLPAQGPATLFANIASSFGISDEAKALYPFLTNPFGASDSQISAFLESVYDNLFNRASDAAGLAYWTGQIKQTLQAGQFVGSILVNIIGGAQDSAAGLDITTLMGKVAVSLAFVHEQQEHHTPWLPGDTAAATTLLQTVTSDPLSVLVGIGNAEELIAAHP